MDCKHKLEDLMGVADGVICTRCGKHFDHIPKQEEPAKIEEPVKKARKAPAKKGAK